MTMRTVDSLSNPQVIQTLAQDGIIIARTDTIYGILASARSQTAVNRVYSAKTRTPSKSPIVLISSLDQLFDTYDKDFTEHLSNYWPGKNSLILPSATGPEWITRGNGSIAYRMPQDNNLRQLIDQTGPLIAPSANPEGETPAASIEAAKKYFGDTIDLYVDGGVVDDDTPSSLYRLHVDGSIDRLR